MCCPCRKLAVGFQHESEHVALCTIAEHGVVRVTASSNAHFAFDRLVKLGLADTTSFNESARFYGLTKLGKQTAAAQKT